MSSGLPLLGRSLTLRVARGLAASTQAVEDAQTRLSTGLRINRGVDDAAGISVASSLEVQNRVFNQALRNINDVTNLLQVKEGALGALSGITLRIEELAEQAANGIYTFSQRNALDLEAGALSKEFNRIVESTTFNGLNLLGGSSDSTVIAQLGFGIPGTLQISGASITVGTGDFVAGPTYTLGGFKVWDIATGKSSAADCVTAIKKLSC